MKCYKMTELHVGLKEEFEYRITSDMMQKFLEITSDNNPLHVDDDFARKRGFERRIVYGMLTTSWVSTLGGGFLPGRNCLIQGVELKFSKPVYIGDCLTITGEVYKVEVALNYVEVRVRIVNQNNQNVLRGIMKVSVFDD